MIKKYTLIFLWIIHISAIIGVSLGFDDFFFPKSWGSMLYVFLMLILWFPINNLKYALFFLVCFATGIGVEWIGVHTGSLFGSYYYLENLGYKLDGVPYLIGVNWGILVFITHSISKGFSKSKYIIATLGSALMVFLDYFLEQMCEHAGFWKFADGAGWYNYLCWFIVAWVLHYVAFQIKLEGDKKTSYHLYFVQLIFAFSIWMIISI